MTKYIGLKYYFVGRSIDATTAAIDTLGNVYLRHSIGILEFPEPVHQSHRSDVLAYVLAYESVQAAIYGLFCVCDLLKDEPNG